MELNKKRNYKLCFLTGLIAGILIGVSGFSVLVDHRLNSAFESIATLEQIINEKNDQLKNLEEAINSSQYIIKNIDIILEYEELNEDHITSVELETAIKEKYTDILGKEVSSIDLELLVGVVDNRIFKFDNKEFQVHVKQLVLSENLKIWIKVSPW